MLYLLFIWSPSLLTRRDCLIIKGCIPHGQSLADEFLLYIIHSDNSGKRALFSSTSSVASYIDLDGMSRDGKFYLIQ